MRSKIFIDTGAFLALTNSADQYHGEAVSCFEALRARSPLFVTTNFVLDETYTRLRRKAGFKVAFDFGQHVQSSHEIKIQMVDRRIEKIAWEIFQKYKDHPFSYTDCTSFAFMRLQKISEAFAFDKDFKVFGRKVCP